MQYSILTPLLSVSALVCLGCMYVILKNLRVVSAATAAVALFFMALWAMAGALENLFVGEEEKLFMVKVAYIACTMLSPTWILFMATYIAKRSQIKNPLIIAAYGIAFLNLMFNWFNPGNAFYTDVTTVDLGGAAYFKASYGPLFWFHSAYSYALVVLAIVWSLFMLRSKRIRLLHLVLMVIGLAMPVICSMLFILVIPFDFNCIGFIISSLMVLWMYRGQFFSALPLTRQSLIEVMTSGYILLDKNKNVVEMNLAARDMFALAGGGSAERAATEIISGWELSVGETGGQTNFFQSFIHPSLGERYYRVSVNTVKRDGKNNTANTMLLVQDETVAHDANERVRYLEQYDAQTEMFNGQHFVKLLDGEIESCGTRPQTIVLVATSITNYRDCCYIYGNDFGNKMINAVGRILRETIRSKDVLCRFSLDEIFIYMVFNSGGADVSERIENTMLRIYEKLTHPIDVGGIRLTASLCAGIAYAPQHAKTSSKLINAANMARRNVSRLQKYPYGIYHERTGESYDRLLVLDRSLDSALENNELYLVYQPQINVLNNKVVGVEALLRWTHKKLGEVAPVDFIPIAEGNGLIHSIGMWVIEQAINQLKCWADTGFDNLRVGVNVSISQLTDERFSERIISLATGAGINPCRLEFEITESLAMFPEAMKHGHLQKLRTHGFRIAMDDFGMGHSSLNYIKQFPLNTIKIDRVLSHDILVAPTSVAMIQSVSMLCDSLGLDVVVESVEQFEQVVLLKKLGCNVVQGYVYSPPLPADACTEYIKNAGIDNSGKPHLKKKK